jgi:hypothetical protein
MSWCLVGSEMCIRDRLYTMKIIILKNKKPDKIVRL